MGRYPGVYFHTRDKVWASTIKFNGQTIWLGTYKDELTAMKVRDFAIRKLELNRRRYFLDEELGPEIEELFDAAVLRKQGQQISKTRKFAKRNRSKVSSYKKKLIEIQKLLAK